MNCCSTMISMPLMDGPCTVQYMYAMHALIHSSHAHPILTRFFALAAIISSGYFSLAVDMTLLRCRKDY